MWFNKSGKLMKTFRSPDKFRFSFYQNDRLFIQELGKGLLELIGDKLVVLPGMEIFANYEIWALVEGTAGKLIIGSSQNGVFTYNNGNLVPWENDVNDFLKTNKIFSFCQLDKSLIAFGTIQDGIVIVSEDGKLIQHLNKRNGLQNNTILSMVKDNTGNLWLGLDNGIDFVEINSPVTFLYNQEGFGTGYAVAVFNGFIYLGTNNGLFAAPWAENSEGKTPDFNLIPNTVGQVWHLGVYEDILLCGHDNGTYQIEGMFARKISDINGAWKFLTAAGRPEVLIGGNYQGLALFTKDLANKSWQFKTNIKGFNESARVLEEDDRGIIWMTHGFKGVFRIELNNKSDSVVRSDFFGVESGFPSNNYINVFKIDGRLVFTSREGIFRYNNKINRFDRDTTFENLFETKEHISYLRQDSQRNIWFVAGNKTGVLRFREDGSYSLVLAPYEILNHQLVPGFECIYPYSGNEVIFCLENGFAHYSPYFVVPHEADFKAYIRKIEIEHIDSVIFGGENTLLKYSYGKRIPKFKFHKNAIRFLFSSPRYYGNREIEYSYKLDDYNDQWSNWSLTAASEYTNLHEGNYTFSVRARDTNGKISEPDVFRFRILPPWYRSLVAFITYTVLFLLFIFVFIWFIWKRIEISKRKERLKHLNEYRLKEQQYHSEALIAEKEIIKLRNEKLRIAMIHNDKELANQTLNLIQKNKFLLKIKDEIQKLNTQSIDENFRQSKLSLIVKRIDKDLDNEKQWALFEMAFDEVHEDFLKHIKEKFPELSPRDLRLCAYLRMNISSKEIAALMNISTRGVEISRYRLRKKLNIDRETNLSKFIIDF